MKKVVIYPGRFQPMLGHHASVFQQLINFLHTHNTISIEDLIHLKIEKQKCQEVMAILEKLGIAQKES